MRGGQPIEHRWPVIAAVVVVALLVRALPGRVTLFPFWSVAAIATCVLVPVIMVGVTSGSAPWCRVERAATLLFAVIASTTSLINLSILIRSMTTHADALSGIQLLTSSIAIWVTNVLAFSLVYWQMDRGGPVHRVAGDGGRPDWVFPQDDAEQYVGPGWRPEFVDYLFLGYCTATAFSPTGPLPLTARAMMLMMVESSVSLVTIVVTAARSINVLGN